VVFFLKVGYTVKFIEKEYAGHRSTMFIVTGIAEVLFISLFVFQKIGPFDFWWWFAINICILISLVIFFDREFLPLLVLDVREKTIEKILYGIIASILLYAVFFIGNILSRSIFSSAGSGITAIYLLRDGNSLWKIIPLMVFTIGPGEELLWRGYIQRQFSYILGRRNGYFIVVLLYSIFHIGSANYMLITAAFIGGLFWGWLYVWKNTLLLNVTSHVFWDVAVFIVFPLNSWFPTGAAG